MQGIGLFEVGQEINRSALKVQRLRTEINVQWGKRTRAEARCCPKLSKLRSDLKGAMEDLAEHQSKKKILLKKRYFKEANA